MSTCTALIVAAGRGSRFGGPLPKQYALLAGLPVLRRTLEAYRAAPQINSLRVVIAPGDEIHYQAAVEGLALPPPVMGGVSRQQSVLNGLEAMAGDAPDFVAIHDAARPFVPPSLFARCVELAATDGSAVAGLPLADTVRRADEAGAAIEEVARDGLWSAQTPQAFRRELLERARVAAGEKTFGDDAAALVAAGIQPRMVLGDRRNLKITTHEDLGYARELVAKGLAGFPALVR